MRRLGKSRPLDAHTKEERGSSMTAELLLQKLMGRLEPQYQSDKLDDLPL